MMGDKICRFVRKQCQQAVYILIHRFGPSLFPRPDLRRDIMHLRHFNLLAAQGFMHAGGKAPAVYGNDNVRLLGGDVSDGFANAAQNFRNARNNLRQPHNRQVADVKQGFKSLLFHIFAADAGKFRLRRKFFQRVH